MKRLGNDNEPCLLNQSENGSVERNSEKKTASSSFQSPRSLNSPYEMPLLLRSLLSPYLFGARCDGYDSISIDPTVAAQLKKQVWLTATVLKDSIISDYVKYMSEDLFNVFPRRRAIISLKSKIGKNGSARVAPGSMSTEEKELLENEGLTKTLPKGEIILARARYFS